MMATKLEKHLPKAILRR